LFELIDAKVNVILFLVTQVNVIHYTMKNKNQDGKLEIKYMVHKKMHHLILCKNSTNFTFYFIYCIINYKKTTKSLKPNPP